MTSKLYITIKRRFGDVKINWDSTIESEKEVFKVIEDNIEEWKKANRPSIWITLRGSDLQFLSKFVDYGFKIHRTKPDNVLVLYKWIRDGPCTVPASPFSYLGVGGLCINKENKILAIRENYISGPGPWKLPGGFYDREKDRKLSDTAVREVFEETGIKAKFDHVVIQRFLHQGQFKCCDIYTICRLSPIEEEIKRDPNEIAECRWITVEEFTKEVSPLLKYAVEAEMRGDKGLKEVETNYHNHIVYMRELPHKPESQ